MKSLSFLSKFSFVISVISHSDSQRLIFADREMVMTCSHLNIICDVTLIDTVI